MIGAGGAFAPPLFDGKIAQEFNAETNEMYTAETVDSSYLFRSRLECTCFAVTCLSLLNSRSRGNVQYRMRTCMEESDPT